jgi:hypothetical protein
MAVGKTVRDRPVPFLYGLMITTLVALLPLPPLLQTKIIISLPTSANCSAYRISGMSSPACPSSPWEQSVLPGLGGMQRFWCCSAEFLLTGLGSSYYHLDPNDQTLFWDRLPMTLCFAAILSAVVEERVDARAGAVLLRPLLAIGIFSLLLWRWTDDLRLYVWAQFFPFVSLVLILSLFPPKYTGASYWIAAAALYALAKLMEHYDHAVYSLGGVRSGHTLKHLAAAAACFAILKLFQVRRPLETVAHSA